MQNNFQIRFILSSKAGQKSKENIINKIQNAYKNNSNVDIKLTEYAGHSESLAKEWQERYDENALIYVGGGDGTISEVASILKNTNASMGILPIGTGNDFAKTVFKNTTPEKYLDEIIKNSINPQIKK